MNGFLLIDKPEGISSFKAVSKVRRALGIEKAGHCGTLDPLATGLLIACLGRATKLAQFVSKQDKSYITEITLGFTSTTYDRDGELTECAASSRPTQDEILAAIDPFVGDTDQMPPMFSAVKHMGQPLYKYALKNKPVEQTARKVHIECIKLKEYEFPRLTVEVDCSSGTYIRSLAHDLGQQLGCGGYVTKLRRTRIGKWHVEDAVALDSLDDQTQSEGVKTADIARLGRAYIPIESMLDFPALCVTELRATEIPNGVPIRAKDITGHDEPMVAGQLVAVRDGRGLLLAVGRMIGNGTTLTGTSNDPVVEYVRVI